MKKIVGILIILLAVQVVFAGLVTAKELAKISKDDNVVIVSARQPSDYDSKHIKDAVNIDHKELYKADGVSSMLKDSAEIAKIFGAKGITENSKIVIYDDGSGKAAGRLYWIFKYLGAKDVNILDGHIKAWMAARKPVTNKATEITPATFKVSLNPAVYADMAYVKAHKSDANVVLLDVRSEDEYNGKNEDNNLKRFGHIPGAVNLEFKVVMDDKEMMKSKDDIIAIMDGAGVTSDKEIILYCATSVRAGIVFMALTDVLGYPNVRVYDGAYYEWESVADNPIQ